MQHDEHRISQGVFAHSVYRRLPTPPGQVLWQWLSIYDLSIGAACRRSARTRAGTAEGLKLQLNQCAAAGLHVVSRSDKLSCPAA